MAIITINDLHSTLENIRASLLSSTGGDGIISRDDFERLEEQTEDPLEKKMLRSFYDFLLKLDYKPRKRVTKAVIDRGISFLREEVIPQLELRLSLGIGNNQKIARIPESGLAMATELYKITTNKALLSPFEVHKRIADLAKGELFFADYDSEEAQPIEAIFQTYPAQPVTPISFVAALGLDPDEPNNEVTHFGSADSVLLRFIEQHVQAGLSNRARAVVELMKENLNDFRIIIFGGIGFPTPRTNYPVYVIGRGYNGNLAGFTSSLFKS